MPGQFSQQTDEVLGRIRAHSSLLLGFIEPAMDRERRGESGSVSSGGLAGIQEYHPPMVQSPYQTADFIGPRSVRVAGDVARRPVLQSQAKVARFEQCLEQVIGTRNGIHVEPQTGRPILFVFLELAKQFSTG